MTSQKTGDGILERQADSSVVESDDVLILQVPPLFENVVEVTTFSNQCQLLCQQEQAPRLLVLNFERVTFINSFGIGLLVSLLKITQEANVELILQNVHCVVKMALQLTPLAQALKITPDTEILLLGKPKLLNQLLVTHPSICSSTKRLIDVIAALIGLSVTAILFLPIAIAIKLDSPGPILFSQIRHGWMGQHFRIWKFRSMVANAEALMDQVPNEIQGAFFKNYNDPRITRLGWFLRRTSLDELPQFWNVLKGDMSLVGPRPTLLCEVREYSIAEWQRFDVKPGITGEWQVNGRSSIRTFEEVMQLDLIYQKKWSVWHDIKLILKTMQVLFSGV